MRTESEVIAMLEEMKWPQDRDAKRIYAAIHNTLLWTIHKTNTDPVLYLANNGTSENTTFSSAEEIEKADV